MSKELTDQAEINAMMDPTGALERAGLYNPLPVPGNDADICKTCYEPDTRGTCKRHLPSSY